MNIKFLTHRVDKLSGGNVTDGNAVHVTVLDNTRKASYIRESLPPDVEASTSGKQRVTSYQKTGVGGGLVSINFKKGRATVKINFRILSHLKGALFGVMFYEGAPNTGGLIFFVFR